MRRPRSGIVTSTLLLALLVGPAGSGGGRGGRGVLVPTDPIANTPANAVKVASMALAASDIISGFNADPGFPGLYVRPR